MARGDGRRPAAGARRARALRELRRPRRLHARAAAQGVRQAARQLRGPARRRRCARAARPLRRHRAEFLTAPPAARPHLSSAELRRAPLHAARRHSRRGTVHTRIYTHAIRS